MSDTHPVTIELADLEDELAVRRVLDAAVLTVDALRERLAEGDVLVAREDGRVLGTIVLEPRSEGAHVTAIAVRRSRRGQRIGTRLVEEALDRAGHLTADFDRSVREFWVSLDFTIEERGDDRLWGTRPS